MGKELSHSELSSTIIGLLEDKKAEDVISIDLSDKDYITKEVIIATALVDKHITSLLNLLKSELKDRGVVFYAIDDSAPEWVIADLGDIIVHLFTSKTRARFCLEGFLSDLRLGRLGGVREE